MNVSYKRQRLKLCTKYSSSEKWRDRVDRMHDYQVLAVYSRFERAGLFIR